MIPDLVNFRFRLCPSLFGVKLQLQRGLEEAALANIHGDRSKIDHRAGAPEVLLRGQIDPCVSVRSKLLH